ncbi:MAG: tetratricopeptide repeat protein [Candidatus Eremiobacteraeota bacterium]|nr:tetratricopeptide repeat protein [Candidatus Eremiobacteraeota bacterium]
MRARTPFGSALRERRRALGLTQEQLAELVSCAEATVRKIEGGRRRPSLQIAALLADRLRVPELDRSAFLTLAREKPSDAHEDLGTSEHPVEEATPASRDDALRTNLPTPLSRLIGREAVVAGIVDFFGHAEARVVSLIGPAGIGKTRLAIAVGRKLLKRYPDGVWFIPLDVLSDYEAVPAHIARVLGIETTASTAPLERLRQALGQRRVLLVLDNFEHVADAASVVAELLTMCPGVAALVTSREALHVRGELTFAVPPLQLPNLNEACSLEALEANDAVALFADAARAVAPSFVLNERNARDAAMVCIAVEGLPLAIELLAGHMRALSVQELAMQLNAGSGGSTLALLNRGPVDLPPRQRVLRTAIDESYRRLSLGERKTFARLAAFTGDFSLSAALHVAGDSTTTRPQIAEHLGNLIEKALLKRSSDDADEPRYVMLRIIREFAREQLGGADDDVVSRRHADYFLSLARDARGRSLSDEELSFDRLEREYHNIGSALDWAVSRDDAVLLGQFGAALWPFWWRRARFDEAWGYFARPLERRNEFEERLRAELLLGAATIARCRCEYDSAASLVEESIAEWQALGDRTALARAFKEAGTLSDCRGEFEKARALLRQSIDMFAEGGDDIGQARALGNLGVVEQELGNLDAAWRYHTESLNLCRRVRYHWGIAAALNNLGLVARQGGDWLSAISAWEQTLAVLRESGEEKNAAACLGNLAMAALKQGDPIRAKHLLAESRTLAEKNGDRQQLAIDLSHLGDVSLHEGELGKAAILLSESLTAFADLADAARIAWCMKRLAEVAHAGGHTERSVALMGAAESVLEAASLRAFPDDIERDRKLLDATRAAMRQTAWNKAWARGKRMVPQRAISFALEATRTRHLMAVPVPTSGDASPAVASMP